MRTIFTAFFLTLLIVAIIFGGLYFFSFMFVPGSSNAGLKITTNLPVSISVDGQVKGEGTSVELKNLKTGVRTVQLTVTDSSYSGTLKDWSRNIKLGDGTLSSLTWNFGADEASSSGSIVALEKANKNLNGADVTVISTPDGANVSFDGESKGTAPITLPGLSQGEHTFVVSKEGYQSYTLSFRLLAQHTYQAEVSLARESKPEETAPAVEQVVAKVAILNTPTGWLRVRNSPGLGGTEVAKVNPGEEYPLLEEKSGWMKIRLSDGSEGWVLGQYAKKL